MVINRTVYFPMQGAAWDCGKKKDNKNKLKWRVAVHWHIKYINSHSHNHP